MDLSQTKPGDLRRGDSIEIEGGYQYYALTEGPPIQRFWHSLKTQQIDQYCKPEPVDFVVDIGCGSGVIAEYLARHARYVIGIDSNVRAIEFARDKFPRANLEYRHALIEDVDFEDGTIDRIYSLEVIEHIYFHQAERLLQKAHQILKTSGHIFLTTPNYRGLWPAIEFAMDSLHLAPRMEDDQHVTHYHRKLLQRLLADNGFHVIAIKTFSTFAPFLAYFPAIAGRIAAFERNVDLPFGNILMAIAVKS